VRTLLFLIAGFLLLATLALLAKLFSSNYPAAPTRSTVAFVALWFVIAAGNMWAALLKQVTRLEKNFRYSYLSLASRRRSRSC
jgi:hypothetical protein